MSSFDSSILVDGTLLIEGDIQIIGVIYYNLTGRNFRDPPSWKVGTHEDYLAYMESKYGPLKGRNLSLVEHGAVIETASVGSQLSQNQAGAQQ